jgi:hypothetical protein
MEKDDQATGDGGAAMPEKPGKKAPEEPPPPDSESLAGTIVSHLQSVTEPMANVGGAMASALGTMIGAAGQAMSGPAELAGRIHRAVSPDPLANLYELYPEARSASPRELGLRFVPLEDLRGTAVAGHAQRGTDFLPLRQYRGENWHGRWQRILDANERLQPLPPVDLVKFGPDYWVVDGHNRVAAALSYKGAGLDAMVTELVPLDGQASERPTHLLSLIGESRELRAAAEGHRPAIEMRYAEQGSAEEPDASEEPDEPSEGRR